MASWLNKVRVRFARALVIELNAVSPVGVLVLVNMSGSQDTSFCVPVYGGQAESASDSQDKDHTGRQQDRELSGELVPVFCPSWRDTSQTTVERRKEEDETFHNGSLVSSLSDGHRADKRPGSERSADVRHFCTGCLVVMQCHPALHLKHTYCTYLQERKADGNPMVGCSEADKRLEVSSNSHP